jgi:hypothetical protein
VSAVLLEVSDKLDVLSCPRTLFHNDCSHEEVGEMGELSGEGNDDERGEDRGALVEAVFGCSYYTD